MVRLSCNFILSENHQEIKGKVLKDYSSTGRKKPWKERRMQSELLAKTYQHLYRKTGIPEYQTKAIRVSECGTF